MNNAKLFFAGIFLFCGIVWGAQQTNPAAQATRAKVTGVVTNSSGQPLRKASVTLLPTGGNQGNLQNRGGQNNTQNQPGQAQRGQQGQPGQNANAQNRGGGNAARSVTTGDDGVFSFADVVPGTYRVRVDRDGYLSQEYGQKSWTGAGVPITLQPSQTMAGISFQLVQGGTIVGRILDENLEPVTGIQVEALAYIYQNGNRTLISERQVETNDLGEYRLYWLAPGDHYVSAIPNSRRGGLVQGTGGFQRGGRGGPPPFNNSENQSEQTYAPTFYPGSIEPETAAPVRIAAASEVRGIDFVLRPTPTVKVSGRVIGMEVAPTAQQVQQQAQQPQQQRGRGNNNGGNRGGRGPFNGNMQVLLTRVGATVTGGRGGPGGGGGGGRGGRGGGLAAVQSIAPVNADGTFEIDNVIPGSYNLIAIQEVQNQVNSTRTRLDVGPGGVQGLSLAVRPGLDIPGQIYVEGTAPANFQYNRLRVSLNSQDGLPINSNAQVDEAGKFTLPGVAAMTYRVNVQGLPNGAYLIAGRLGSTDALGDPVSIDQAAQLALQIGFTPGQVGVTVTDAVGQPFAGAITVLIPATRNRVDLYKTATSDAAGLVAFSGIAPGDYKVVAWEDVPQGAYLNADFLQPFEDRAQSIHVDRASSVTAQLKVIPRNEQ